MTQVLRLLPVHGAVLSGTVKPAWYFSRNLFKLPDLPRRHSTSSPRRQRARVFSSPTMANDVAPTQRRVKVAVGQMTACSNTDTNFRTCSRLVQDAVAQGVKLLSLPECFSFIGSKEGEALGIAEPLSGPIIQRYQSLAREAGIWLALGGFQESGPDDNHIFNTHVLLDDAGTVRFDVDVQGGPVLKESRSTSPGAEVVVADSPAGRLGLTVCYDLRFPELYQRLRFLEHAQLLLVPSAFTKRTGEAHWEILLRARAVETQCYVLAAAQAGVHNERRESYGDAMIVDPWGTVVARVEDKLATGIAVAEIDLELLDSVRSRMPIQQHRRYDLYGTSAVQASSPPLKIINKYSSL